MAGVKQRLDHARNQRPWLDHVLRMQEHYGQSKAGQQAGAVTYFAFLSFFPVLALGFFVVGYLSEVYPDANQNLTDAIDSILPGIIGPGESQIALEDVRTFSGLAGIVGLLGVLYSGLGWVSALRDALTVVFETPQRELLNFVKGKLRDLLALGVVGLVLVLAVAVAGFVAGFSETVLDWVGLGSELSWLVRLLAIVLGLGANMVLFFAMFRLLAEPVATRRSLWSGALLGAVGFEILKQLSSLLLASTKGQPAFQAFGIALILVVWINYFSRLILYAASWAHTAADTRALIAEQQLAEELGEPDAVVLVEPRLFRKRPSGDDAPGSAAWAKPFAAGGAAMLAVVAVVRRRDR